MRINLRFNEQDWERVQRSWTAWWAGELHRPLVVIEEAVQLSLECLGGVQWIPGTGSLPPEEWLPLLKRVRDAGKLCQLYVSPEGTQTIVRALGGRGFIFYVDQCMSQDKAEAGRSTFVAIELQEEWHDWWDAWQDLVR